MRRHINLKIPISVASRSIFVKVWTMISLKAAQPLKILFAQILTSWVLFYEIKIDSIFSTNE